jgi:NAD(P)-dependent dehydrogenase (short-subunit alcohol dehydrogenase family)
MKVLITGTSRGIGRACAMKYLAEGHEVIGLDLCGSTIQQEQARYCHYVADITGPLPEISGVQILVNNAGVQEGGREIDINLKGTIAVTEKYAFTPDIRSVLFMASSSASNGAEFPLYAASKGGVVAYMKNVALRIAHYGATCNSISAGGVLTELNRHIIEDPRLMEMCLNETLLHRWAEAEEIAQLCYFLTNINRSMTGQDLLIDNGEQLKSNFIW